MAARAATRMQAGQRLNPHTLVSRASLAFAYGGGLVFLASLIWFLYCYMFVFEAAPAGGAGRPILVNALLFTIFAAHHSVFARTGLKTRVKERVGPQLERSVYTWVASVLFIAVCAWWQPLPGVLYRLPWPFALGGYLAQIAAVVITIRAAGAIDMLDLAGIRPVLLARSGEPPRHVPLETRGVYAFVRHPVYFAWALLVCAVPTMTATRAMFAIISTLYVALAIPWEERTLVDVFGNAYEAYRRQVRWRMIPGVY